MTTTEPPFDVDTLPPTQYLLLEVLAARYRLGESYWTFPDRCAPPARALEQAGLIWTRSGPVQHHFEARFTDAGRTAALSDAYTPPIARHTPTARASDQTPACNATNHHPCQQTPAGMFGAQHHCAREPHAGAAHRCRCGVEWAWTVSSMEG